MKYAVIQCGGKQYHVTEGQILTVDKLDQPIDSVYEFPQILLVRNDEDIFIGNPIVPGASVTGKITGKGKGKKITVE